MAKKKSEDTEGKFQSEFKKKLKSIFPGCYLLRLDPNDIQGIPDLLVLHKDKWAALELKRAANAPHRYNQDWYVDELNKMSYSSFVYPENEETVIEELKMIFQKE